MSFKEDCPLPLWPSSNSGCCLEGVQEVTHIVDSFLELVQGQPGGSERWFCHRWGSPCLGQHLNRPLLLLSLCLNQPLLLFSLSISFCLSFLSIPLSPELVNLHPLGQEPVHGIHYRKRSLWVSAMGTMESLVVLLSSVISTTKTTTKFGVPPLLNTITRGGFTGKKTKNHHITDNAFSYIRTEFGVLRSRRLAVKHVGD